MYSAAMYDGDFTRVREFGRLDKSGRLRLVHNLNLIFAGETIYHIPTYKKAHPLRMDGIEVKASPLSEEQKKKVIVDTLKADFDLKGERLKVLEHAAHYVHGADTAVELVEIAGWIAEGTALAAAASVLQLVSALLTPIAIGIAILNANETDKKLAGMQAIGYSLTAWAFGDPIPPFPSSLRANFSNFPGQQALPRVEQAWTEASEATVRNLEAEVLKKRRHKKSYRDFWQALGSGDRKKLARLLMEARAEELHGVERMSFWALDPEGYPN
ncbi:MAG: hypothetical protein LAQ69_48635 [Acidobacteriia bacterium]|nr:hypothetical protein [Terriglobia bacterium]